MRRVGHLCSVSAGQCRSEDPAVTVEAMSNQTKTTKTTTRKTTRKSTPKRTRWFVVNGRPLPKTQAAAHLCHRFVRTDDGEKMTTAEFRTWLADQGIDGDNLLAKSWKVTTPNGHEVGVAMTDVANVPERILVGASK